MSNSNIYYQPEQDTGSWGTMGSLMSKFLDLYNPILGKVCSAPTGRMMPPPEELTPNRANMAADFSQRIMERMTPNSIKGFQFNVATPIGSRMTRTHSFKWVGPGNPMMQQPGNSFETNVQWQGNSDMTSKGPKWQASIGPFNFNELFNGNFSLKSQIINVGDTQMHVFVNDWDINKWNIFMSINKFDYKFNLGPLGKQHIKFKNTLQCPDGLIRGMQSGQSQMESELAYHVGRLGRMNVTAGLNWKSQVGVSLELLKQLPLQVLGADPYLIFKYEQPPFEEDKNFNSDNMILFKYNRQANAISMDVASMPVTLNDPLVEMGIKSPTFLKQVPKDARDDYFRWAQSERNSYYVRANVDLNQKKMDWSVGMNTKVVGRPSGLTLDLKAPPGHIMPTLFNAVLEENMVMNKSDTTPLTTQISITYDMAKAEVPPQIGLGMSLEL